MIATKATAADARGEQRDVANADTGGDHERGQREADDERRTEVAENDETAAGGGDAEEGHQRRDPTRGHLRALGEQRDSVEDQSELHQLGGLDLHRPGADPGARAVDLHADPRYQDRGAEDERAAEDQRRRVADQGDAAQRKHAHDQKPDHAEDHRALEVEGAVARLAQQLGRGAGAEDHDHAEGEQAQGRGQQHRVLDGLRRLARLGAHAQLLDESLEVLAAFGVVAIGVEAGASRCQQHDLARMRVRGGAANRIAERRAAAMLDPGRPRRLQVLLDQLGRLSDQVAADAALADDVGEAVEALALEAAAENRAHTAVERAQPDLGRGDIRRLGIVDEDDAVDLGHRLEPVGNAFEAAQAGSHGADLDPGGKRGRRGGRCVERVVVAEELQLVGADQTLVTPPDRLVVEAGVGLGVAAERDSRGVAQPCTEAADLGRAGNRDVVSSLAFEQPQLGRRVGIEGAVAVEMVGGDVEQGRHLR